MTEATNLITAYAFKNFDIIRIQATVNDNNPASMRILEKAGFKKEGIMKNAIVKYGEVMDEHLYALLK
jgi:ribosomal-protein-alanine N-acetyltransferase